MSHLRWLVWASISTSLMGAACTGTAPGDGDGGTARESDAGRTIADAGNDPAPSCGDGTCDPDESCVSCLSDCGQCSAAVCESLAPTASTAAPETWLNAPQAAATRTLDLELMVRPSETNLNGLITIGDGEMHAFSDASVLLRLSEEGVFDGRDGDTYVSTTRPTYDASSWYRVRISVDLDARRWSAEVGPCDGDAVRVVENARFRESASSVSRLDHLGLWTGNGTLDVANVRWEASSGGSVDAGVPATDAGTPGPTGACSDGIDNDGDGWVDYDTDLGCYGPDDNDETAGPREAEDGWTTFDLAADSRVVFVSNEGDDGSDGASPSNPVRTLTRAASLVRDGQFDAMLLRRGDRWRGEQLGRFKSGRSATEPLIIGAYGTAMERPRVEVSTHFINVNGAARSHLALVGLHLLPFRNIPGDPEFTGASHEVLRFVGQGSGILIEDCHIEYGEIIASSYEGLYSSFAVRRSVIERAYHADTCTPGNPNGNHAYRPSGIYASGIDGFLIEENVFDHNGWNAEEVPSACATIYNHNIYTTSLRNVVMRGNFFSRPSSIHIKTAASTSGPYDDVTIDDNFFVGGEIGISIGGNNPGPARFRDVVITRNVMNQVGRGRPTTRGLSWGIGVQDNDVSRIEDNLLLNFDEGNSYGVMFEGKAENNPTNREVELVDNLFYAVRGSGILITNFAGFTSNLAEQNLIVDPRHGSCLVRHEGAPSQMSYRSNQYFSASPASDWFCVGTSRTRTPFTEWVSRSGESGASNLVAAPAFPDASVTLDRYAGSLGMTADWVTFIEAALGQSRMHWRRDLTAAAINDYMRAGFGR